MSDNNALGMKTGTELGSGTSGVSSINPTKGVASQTMKELGDTITQQHLGQLPSKAMQDLASLQTELSNINFSKILTPVEILKGVEKSTQLNRN